MKTIFTALTLMALSMATPASATPLTFKYTFQTGDRITGHISEGSKPLYYLDSVVPAPVGDPKLTLPGPPGDFDFMDFRDLPAQDSQVASFVLRDSNPNGQFLGVDSQFHQDGSHFHTGMYITPGNRVFFQWLNWKVTRPDPASYRVSSTPETWEFLFPGTNVPDGGSAALLLTMSSLALAAGKKFLAPVPLCGA